MLNIFTNEIAEKLNSEVSNLTIASNLFIGELPESTDGIYITQEAGIEPDVYTGVEYYELVFTCLDKSRAVCYERLEELYNYFNRKAHYETDNFYIYLSRALGQYSDLGRGVDGRSMARLSVLFIVRYNSLIS